MAVLAILVVASAALDFANGQGAAAFVVRVLLALALVRVWHYRRSG
jgi:hypothetical protein